MKNLGLDVCVCAMDGHAGEGRRVHVRHFIGVSTLNCQKLCQEVLVLLKEIHSNDDERFCLSVSRHWENAPNPRLPRQSVFHSL